MEGAVAAGVRDRERAALDVVGHQLLVPRLGRDLGDPLRDPEQVHGLGVADDRHDQALALGELDGDAEVDEVAGDDRVAAHLAVDIRIVAQRLHRRLRDEGEVGRVDAVGGLVVLLQLLAGSDDLRHVDLDRARDVRRRVERAAHVLGDPAAHGRDRLELLPGQRLRGRGLRGGCRRLRRGLRGRLRRRHLDLCLGRLRLRRLRLRCGGPAALLDEAEDVLLRHPAAAAGALDLAGIDPVLGGDAGDDGRDELAVPRRLLHG